MCDVGNPCRHDGDAIRRAGFDSFESLPAIHLQKWQNAFIELICPDVPIKRQFCK
jgi:hypothetical protein